VIEFRLERAALFVGRVFLRVFAEGFRASVGVALRGVSAMRVRRRRRRQG
jgi:hypothetical protein